MLIGGLLAGCGSSPDEGPPPSPSTSASATVSAESPTPTTEPTEDVSPTAAATCPDGIVLPEGVDPRACGPIPAEATEVTGGTHDEYLGSIGSGSKNVGCDFRTFDDELTVDCIPMEYSFQESPEPTPPCEIEGSWRGEVAVLTTTVTLGYCATDANAAFYALQDLTTGEDNSGGLTVEVLPYGQMRYSGDLVCLSAKEGMTCWNAETGHGFRLSREAKLVW